MCGRFAFYSTIAAINKAVNIKTVSSEIDFSYNIAPMQEVLAVTNENELTRISWGLVPFFAKDKKFAPKMINARFETISEKPSFKRSFAEKRCIILANGFYEWKKNKNTKQPYYIFSPAREILTFAGIFDEWKGHKTCAIITKESAGDISEIHHRMPVILKEQALDTWLDEKITNKDSVKDLVLKNSDDELVFNKVSDYVNKVKNNSADCIKPVN